MFAFGLGVESLADGVDHLEEPVKVQRVQGHIAADVDRRQPYGYRVLRGHELHGFGIPGRDIGLLGRYEVGPPVNTGPDIAIEEDRLIGAPHQTAREEGGDQHEAVVELSARTSHAELVKEPVDIEEGRGQLPQDKVAAIEIDKWPKPERVDENGADGVGQHTETKNIHVGGGNAKVPEEIAASEGLDHGGAPRVAPEALLLVHLLALLIGVHDPQGQGADGGALHEGHDVDVPVQLLGLGQGGILAGEDARREPGRHDAPHELVEARYYDDLMDVQRQGGQVEIVGPRLHGVAEGGNGRYRKGVLHFLGEVRFFCRPSTSTPALRARR